MGLGIPRWYFCQRLRLCLPLLLDWRCGRCLRSNGAQSLLQLLLDAEFVSGTSAGLRLSCGRCTLLRLFLGHLLRLLDSRLRLLLQVVRLLQDLYRLLLYTCRLYVQLSAGCQAHHQLMR
jgi:hypothetical protein